MNTTLGILCNESIFLIVKLLNNRL